jgi:hypothetical protein
LLPSEPKDLAETKKRAVETATAVVQPIIRHVAGPASLLVLQLCPGPVGAAKLPISKWQTGALREAAAFLLPKNDRRHTTAAAKAA